MKLIVGLGNIGDKYKNNRHNIGFQTIDFLAKTFGITLDQKKFNGEFYKCKDFILSKPHTFMNLSGDFVYDICKFYKIDLEDVLIIHDDMDMKLGQLRHKSSGSAGGHNGMNDIMVKMDTNKINRLKIGIGRPSHYIVDYVLSDFKNYEKEVILLQMPKINNFVVKFINNQL